MEAQKSGITLSKNLMGYFFPIALGFVLQQVYSLTDAFILGRYVGKTALVAVGGTNLTVINLFITVFTGFR